MAKRFTDSRKWYDPWFRKLPSEYKMFWYYITDTCDHAGFWKVDVELASFCIGQDLSSEKIIKFFNNGKERIRLTIKPDVWFLPSFIPFQYGQLNPNNNLHISVLNTIKNAGVNEGLVRGYLAPMVKDKDKEEDKGVSVECEKRFNEVWNKYPDKVGRKDALRHFKTSVKTDKDYVDIQTALENYKLSERVMKGFVQNGSTWFNDWQGWVDKKVDPMEKWRAK